MKRQALIEAVAVVLLGALAALLVSVWWMESAAADSRIKRAARSVAVAKRQPRAETRRVFPKSHRFKTAGRCLDHGKWIKGCG